MLESSAIEGNSPVIKTVTIFRSILSSAEHEKFRVNLGGPPSKAKYTLVTDSE